MREHSPTHYNIYNAYLRLKQLHYVISLFVKDDKDSDEGGQDNDDDVVGDDGDY